MTQTDKDPADRIAFQGLAGAYSHLACNQAYGHLDPLPCVSFEATFEAVANGVAALAMIPIENSVAGRVADIHHLLPDSGLHIIAEHFQRVTHQLLVVKGATIEGLKTVHSHVHALPQCRMLIQELGLEPLVHADTAGAAAELAASGDRTAAVIASTLAAENSSALPSRRSNDCLARVSRPARSQSPRNRSPAMYSRMLSFLSPGLSSHLRQ